MGKCVYCGHQGSNSKTATLHTFPSDEAVCKEWVKLIGQEGWKPTKSSFLCSKHFTEDSFVFHYNNRKRLKPGRVPTILNNGPRFPEQRKVLVERNCAAHGQDQDAYMIYAKKRKVEPSLTVMVESNCSRANDNALASSMEIVEAPEPSVVIDYSNTPATSKEILNPENCAPGLSKQRKETAEKKKCESLEVRDHIRHDHRYDNTPRSMKYTINNFRKRLDSMGKEKKRLQERVTRLKRKVNTLQDIVQALKEQKLLPESAYYSLSAQADVSLELFNRMIKNRKDKNKITRNNRLQVWIGARGALKRSARKREPIL